MGGVRESLGLCGCIVSLGALLLGGCGPEVSPGPEPFAHGALAFPGRSGTVMTTSMELPGLGRRVLTYERIHGQAVLEGDILLDLAKRRAREAQGVDAEAYHWPRGVIPYVIDAELAHEERVRTAIHHWEGRSALRFKPRTTETDYVRFAPGVGCGSSVGRVGGEQKVYLAEECGPDSTLHEVGHAMGLWHEPGSGEGEVPPRLQERRLPAGETHDLRS